MDEAARASGIARAEAFLRLHFDRINAGDLEAARAQLFLPPGLSVRPQDIYLARHAALAPLEILELNLFSFRDVRPGKPPRAEGPFSSVTFDVRVRTSDGERTGQFGVWCFVRTDALVISTRSSWVPTFT